MNDFEQNKKNLHVLFALLSLKIAEFGRFLTLEIINDLVETYAEILRTIENLGWEHKEYVLILKSDQASVLNFKELFLRSRRVQM